LLAVVVALVAGAVPASAFAAAPPPESTANCYGGVTRAPTSDEPNALSYKFHCDQAITAFTLLVNRGSNYDTLDDFDTSPLVTQADGTTADTTTSWACEGYTPGQSFNCNTGGGKTLMNAWSYVHGSFDPTGPYCKYIPSGAKPGSPAVPRAIVQVVVSDISGAEDGPFRLYYTGKCHPSPDRAAARSKTKQQRHQTAKGSK
jgi:hypothetical protein